MDKLHRSRGGPGVDPRRDRRLAGIRPGRLPGSSRRAGLFINIDKGATSAASGLSGWSGLSRAVPLELHPVGQAEVLIDCYGCNVAGQAPVSQRALEQDYVRLSRRVRRFDTTAIEPFENIALKAHLTQWGCNAQDGECLSIERQGGLSVFREDHPYGNRSRASRYLAGP